MAHAQWKNCRNSDGTMYGHVAVYESLTCALAHVSAVDSKLEVRFRLFIFRSASPPLILKNTTPSHTSIIDNIVNTGYGA